MHILIISNLFPTPSAPHGGIFITQRVRALRAQGHSVTAVALETCPQASMVARGRPSLVDPANDDVFVRLLTPLTPLSRAMLRLGRYEGATTGVADALVAWASSRSFDVIHAHGMYSLPAGAVAKHVAERLGLDYVVTCHGSDINLVMPRNPEGYTEVFAAASGVTFPSSDLLARAQRAGMRSDRIAVIPNGVDSAAFAPAQCQGSTAPSQIAFIGNLRHVKGADRLPALFHDISALRNDVRFKVVGTGPLMRKIRRKTRGLDIQLVGHVAPDGVAAIMRESRIVVMPSRSEGFGCVALEAQACGVPVVATKVGGLPEAIGDSRLMVDEAPSVVADLARLCVKLLDRELPVDPNVLVTRARAYDWSVIAEREAAFLADGVNRLGGV